MGGALLYMSLTDRWSAWTYLWSVLPFSLGLGMYAAGWIADAPAFKWIGSGVAAGGVVAYLAFATAFGGEAFRRGRGHRDHRARAGAHHRRPRRSAQPEVTAA